jgi:heptosyltransferase-2/heptosyltransferase-3
MNFPGLDPLWRGGHRTLHRLGLLPTWRLDDMRTVLDRGERVLVVATTALGDSLLATPLIETLSRALGRDRVSFLVREPYAPLYRDDPRLRRVFTVRGKYRWAGLRRELARDPHGIALLANLTEPDLVPWLRWGGARGFLRYRTRWSQYPEWMANREMLRAPGDPDYATGHAIENNLALAAALGVAASATRLALPQFGAEAKTERRVVIHPGASRAIKQWQVENWARLADRMVERFDCDIVLTGDGREIALAETVRAKMEQKARTQTLAGRLDLRQLAALQAASLAFLSGDTGPYHLAVAVGCPTMTLFAPTDRGSSIEACGPHEADPVYHRALQTAHFGDAIATLDFARVEAEAAAVVEASLIRAGMATK